MKLKNGYKIVTVTAAFALFLGTVGCDSETGSGSATGPGEEANGEEEGGGDSVGSEASWQEEVEYPFPSAEMLEIWGQPYTYPYEECVALEAGHSVPAEAVTVDEDGVETLCFWQNAQGCMPGEIPFPEYGSCDVAMTTSARFYKFPGYKFESNVTLLDEPEYQAEADWARKQIRSCGCLCCHDSKMGAEAGFATAFDLGAEGIWTDTMSDFGLLTAAGVIDTELLGGTFDPDLNHGFNRVDSIFPSDDEDRLTAFFLGEIERRGLTDEEIQELVDSVPVRFAGLYTNYVEETEPCQEGYGVDPEGIIHFGEGNSARYVYVMEEGSDNIGDPPGLDMPEGILWRMDTLHEAEPVLSGAITYGVAPEGTFTRVPENGLVPQLEEGTRYKMFVLRDFGPLRLANCSFVFGEAVAAE